MTRNSGSDLNHVLPRRRVAFVAGPQQTTRAKTLSVVRPRSAVRIALSNVATSFTAVIRNRPARATVILRVERAGVYWTVTAMRNGAVSLIAETKSNVVIFTPGRGLSRVFR
jgi:hypothetical protein